MQNLFSKIDATVLSLASFALSPLDCTFSTVIIGIKNITIINALELHNKFSNDIPARIFNPRRTGGGVFHQARGFLPITLEVIKLHSRNLVTLRKI